MPTGTSPPSSQDDPAAASAAHSALPSAEAREQALYRRLAALGIVWVTHDHAPVFTVEEAQALRGTLPGIHTKNLFVEDRKGALWLITTRESRIDLNALARELGRPRFSFGKPELLVVVLGVPPGSVTPFALMNDLERRVTAIFDAQMLLGDPLNFHPLRNDRTSAVAAADLVRFAQETGHPPLIRHLPERPL